MHRRSWRHSHLQALSCCGDCTPAADRHGRDFRVRSSNAKGRPMSVHQRRDAILERLERDAKLSVAELASQLQVSEMTVRRDLEAMERSGVLQRVHGGAVTAQSRSYEPPFAVRSMRHVEAKQRIGQAAA